MACGVGCARALLIAFNFLFWLSGAAVLGVGIWFLVDPKLQDYNEVINITKNERDDFRNAAYLFIAFGTFIFLVGFCGCCGAIRSSKCLLGFYIFFLCLVFAGELAAGILAAVFKDEINNEFESELTSSIRSKYSDQSSWDVIQKELMCCGGAAVNDYENSTWQSMQPDPMIKIPLSCCTLNENGTPVQKDSCQQKISDYYQEPCKDKLMNWIDQHSVILIGVGCGIAALQIFGLVVAIILCRTLDQQQEKY